MAGQYNCLKRKLQKNRETHEVFECPQSASHKKAFFPINSRLPADSFRCKRKVPYCDVRNLSSRLYSATPSHFPTRRSDMDAVPISRRHVMGAGIATSLVLASGATNDAFAKAPWS